MSAKLVLLCALAALCVVTVAGQAAYNVPCETITKINGCIECIKKTRNSGPSAGKKPGCYACQRDLWPLWNTDGSGRIKQCQATVIGGEACKKLNPDNANGNCIRCEGTWGWCQRCTAGTAFNKQFQCVKQNCQQITQNSECVQCNADTTCRSCRNDTSNRIQYLRPRNAKFLTATFFQSNCLTRAEMDREARAIYGKPAVMPPNCLEVGSDYICNQCKIGFSLGQNAVGSLECTRITPSTGSKCINEKLAYRGYCTACNPNNPLQCVSCTDARSLVTTTDTIDGKPTQITACRLPCKLLFGTGCLRCNAQVCTERDALYANGR